jgi:integrase
MASIAKRSDGRWRARYRDDAGREHARHFTRKVDAQRWLDEVTASMVTGAYVDPKAGRVTFAGYFADWSKRQVWETSTERAMRAAARSVTFGDVGLAALRRSHIERWVKTMQIAPRGDGQPPGLAPGTIRTRVNNVRAVLRGAVRDRVIASDPSDGITLPRVRRPEAAMRLPEPAQVRALLDAAPGRWRAFVALCAFAGLRLGEAAALRVSDIDFLRRTLTVVRQVQRGPRGAVEIRPPKYGSERTVYLADGLVEILAAHVGEHCPGEDPARYLFARGGEVPPYQQAVGRWWDKARAAPGLSAVKLHDLRHFYASGLIAAGCDVVTVQRALGHASASVTLGTYAHLWPTAEDKTRAAVAAMLADTLRAGAADSVRTFG